MFTQKTNRKLITRERSDADCLLSVLWGRRCWLQPKRHESVIPVGTNCKRNVAVFQHWSKKCKYCNGLYTVFVVLFIMSHRKLVDTGSRTRSVLFFWTSGRRSLTRSHAHSQTVTHTITYSLTHPLTQTLTFTHTVTLTHSLQHCRTHALTHRSRQIVVLNTVIPMLTSDPANEFFG